MVLLLISVVLAPLLGDLYREFAIPLNFVVLVLRVGGFGHQFVSGSLWEQTRVPFGLASLKPDRNPIAIRRMSSASLLARWGQELLHRPSSHA